MASGASRLIFGTTINLYRKALLLFTKRSFASARGKAVFGRTRAVARAFPNLWLRVSTLALIAWPLHLCSSAGSHRALFGMDACG